MGISSFDLSVCFQDLKNFYKISNEKNFIILNYEMKDNNQNNKIDDNNDKSFNLGKYVQAEIYDYIWNIKLISIFHLCLHFFIIHIYFRIYIKTSNQ